MPVAMIEEDKLVMKIKGVVVVEAVVIPILSFTGPISGFDPLAERGSMASFFWPTVYIWLVAPAKSHVCGKLAMPWPIGGGECHTRSMATVSASHFVSRSSAVNSHGAPGSKSTPQFAQIGMRSQQATHSGLRSLKNLDGMVYEKKVEARQVQVKKPAKSPEPGKIVCRKGMGIVFVGAEVGPWSKTGGLGDVLGGLPPALAARGHRVMTVSPRYDQYRDAWDTCVLVDIQVGNRVERVRFFHCYKRGVDRVFVDHPMFLEKVWGKTGSKIYGPRAGLDYKDNQLRFSLLSLAALEAPRVLNLISNKYFSGPYGVDLFASR
ncbi:hypothetical protein SAY86_027352 [Trapa natans]|uniref:Starch synthase catalytic domain-containing protein n=1 Tax=Trapa natans TaxID=22666 RepID=A0AAN7QIR9_TRANT|nr:hypothetical protein SAY86_027352 [Trapa natans]